MKGSEKKATLAIFIQDKIDFKTSTVRDKKGDYIIIKGTIQKENVTTANIYEPLSLIHI